MEDNWEVGDIAICVKVGHIVKGRGINPPLKLYGEYVVNGLHHCSCGSINLDVGLISQIGNIRCNCGIALACKEVHWCNSIRFVKKQTKEMIQMELNAAVEAENYELAQVLKERLETV